LEGQNLGQMAYAAQAIVIAFNLEGYNASVNEPLVLNMSLLAAIWSGEVVFWNDPAIASLNHNLTLPNEPIVLVFANDTGGSISDVFAEALAPHNSVFAGLAAPYANETLSMKMPPYSPGRSIVTSPLVDQLGAVLEIKNSMTYAPSVAATLASLPFALMINAAGTIVAPTVGTVQSALLEVAGDLKASYMGVSPLNGNQTNSWPMVIVGSTVNRIQVNTTGCFVQTAIQQFASWIQLNEYISDTLESQGYISLPLTYKRWYMASLSRELCYGVHSYVDNVAIGEGEDFQIGTLLMSTAYTLDPTFQIYSYVVDPAQALNDISLNNVDFSLVGGDYLTNNETRTEYGILPPPADEFYLPLYAFAVVPAYNIPSLVGRSPLILNYSIVADIYLGIITMWNDTAILELNPQLVSYIPRQNIQVVVGTGLPMITTMLTMALSAASPAFQSAVAKANGSFPLQYLPNTALVQSDPMENISDILYSFGIWNQEQVSARIFLCSAGLINVKGNPVLPNSASVTSALQDFASEPLETLMVNGQGNGSWPMVAYYYFVTRTGSFPNCAVARSLTDFVYWMQTSSTASATMSSNSLATPISPLAYKKLIQLITSMTCDGNIVSSYAPCVVNGTICSNHGSCDYDTSACVCNNEFTGKFCQSAIVSTSDTGTIVGAVVGSVVPTILIVLVVIFAVVAIVLWRTMRKKDDEWEVDLSELEIKEQIGMGAVGAVHKGLWNGTEVAIKTLITVESPQRAVVREIERNFREEVRVMTSLRHPNVVLFMGACTKSPNMCIVMEFMTLGSLYELLHNELIPDIPFKLKLKLAYQATKGMHFLHSLGIVHRDLKSLNILLDSKWTVKVSDFGLTKSKEFVGQLSEKGDRQMEGTIHWMAPEVLCESPNVDYMMADVYSFGVIMWELLTREIPYAGLTPAAIAVAVIRDNMRPTDEDVESNDISLSSTATPGMVEHYRGLMREMWDQEPKNRPSFLEAMTRLNNLLNDDVLGSEYSRSADATQQAEEDSSTTASMIHSAMSDDFAGFLDLNETTKVAAPEGEVIIVFSDITRAASLWEFNADAMRDSTLLHNELLRSLLKKYNGYEVVFLSGQGSFCMAFSDPICALSWCIDVQKQLATAVSWPKELLEHPAAAEEWDEIHQRILFKGLRVRMGLHVGQPKSIKDPKTRRVEYVGPVVDTTSHITSMAYGGQVVLSGAMMQTLKGSDFVTEHGESFIYLGQYQLSKALSDKAADTVDLYEIKIEGLDARDFPNLEYHDAEAIEKSTHNGSGNGDQCYFLMSADLCRWIIDYNELSLDKQIGLGSFGVVYRGRWKGVDVAVKRLIKQKLEEKTLLSFRAEIAFLAELRHPNIILFVGACTKSPNLCIVTEYAKQGALREILLNNRIRLPWDLRMKLLRDTASGIAFLHNYKPVIIHRDLKPSNLLVDDEWNVKLADFGLAGIKDENTTMTRCGTPCWTAPEVLKGERYSEKADIYSFGIIMWEVITRKQPFAGTNFIGITLEVLEGHRPPLPKDCPEALAKLIKKCWHTKAEKRPSIDKIIASLGSLANIDDKP